MSMRFATKHGGHIPSIPLPFGHRPPEAIETLGNFEGIDGVEGVKGIPHPCSVRTHMYIFVVPDSAALP